MREGRETESAEFLRDNHAKEFVALDEVPHLGRQIAPLPHHLPLIHHRAKLFDRPVQECGLLGSELGGGIGQQLRPVRIAGEQIGVPPHIARFQRLALGIGHRGKRLMRPCENRLGEDIAAKGRTLERTHGTILFVRRSRGTDKPLSRLTLYRQILTSAYRSHIGLGDVVLKGGVRISRDIIYI